MKFVVIIIIVYPWLLPKQDVKPVTFRTDKCKSLTPPITPHYTCTVGCGLKVPTDELLVGQVRHTHFNHMIVT